MRTKHDYNKGDRNHHTRKVALHFKMASSSDSDSDSGLLHPLNRKEREDYLILNHKYLGGNSLTTKEESRLIGYKQTMTENRSNLKRCASFPTGLDMLGSAPKHTETKTQERKTTRTEERTEWAPSAPTLGAIRKNYTRNEAPDRDRRIIRVLQEQLRDFRVMFHKSGEPYINYMNDVRIARAQNDEGDTLNQIDNDWQEQQRNLLGLDTLIDLLSFKLTTINDNFNNLQHKDDEEEEVQDCNRNVEDLKRIYKKLMGKKFDQIKTENKTRLHSLRSEEENDTTIGSMTGSEENTFSLQELTLYDKSKLNEAELREFSDLTKAFNEQPGLTDKQLSRAYTLSLKSRYEQLKKEEEKRQNRLRKEEVETLHLRLEELEKEKRLTELEKDKQITKEQIQISNLKEEIKQYKNKEENPYNYNYDETELKQRYEGERSPSPPIEKCPPFHRPQDSSAPHRRSRFRHSTPRQPYLSVSPLQLNPQFERRQEFVRHDFHPQDDHQQKQHHYRDHLQRYEPDHDEYGYQRSSNHQNTSQKGPGRGRTELTLREANSMKIPTFSGGKDWTREWTLFWRSFKPLIHDQAFEEDIKVQKLLESLTGNARDTVALAGTPSMPYTKAIEKLMKKYNDSNKTQQILLNDLERMPRPAQNSITAQRQYFEQTESLYNKLQEAGVEEQALGYIVKRSMLKNLSGDLHKDILMRYGRKSLNDIDIDLVFNAWEELIDISDRGLPEESEQPYSFTGLSATNFDNSRQRSTTADNRNSGTQYTQYCIYCQSKTHYAVNCDVIKDPENREKFLNENFRCTKCTRKGHSGRDCRSTPPKSGCRVCNSPLHHTSIHRMQTTRDQGPPRATPHQNTSQQQRQENNGTANRVVVQTVAGITNKSVLLNIINVRAINPHTGERVPINAFLDKGCMMTSLRTDIFRKLQLPHFGKEYTEVGVYGTQDHKTTSHIASQIQIDTEEGVKHLDCRVIDDIVADIDTRAWSEAKRMFPDFPLPQLNDTENKTYRVDLLIGADYHPIINKGTTIIRDELEILDTIMGWVICGTLPRLDKTSFNTKTQMIAQMESPVRKVLRQEKDQNCGTEKVEDPISAEEDPKEFEDTNKESKIHRTEEQVSKIKEDRREDNTGRSRQEEPQTSKKENTTDGHLTEGQFLSMLNENIQLESDRILHSQIEALFDPTEYEIDKNQEKTEILEKFANNLKWNGSQYEVRFNWREMHPPLKPNFNLAKSFLEHNTRRMIKNGTFDAYKAIVQTNVKLGFFKPYPHNPAAGHFVPHFGVERPDSTTTPLRMAFSACTGNPSINDCLYPNISLLNDLTSLIRLTRCYPFAFSGDLSKAFYSVALHEDDIPYAKLLWWANDEPFSEIITLVQCKVGIGFVDSPFNYLATMHTHLHKHPNQFAKQIEPKLYSDNYLDGGFTREETSKKIYEAIAIMSDGGFNLRKFVTNDQKIRNDLINNKLLDTSETPSLLGMVWELQDDTLKYKVPDTPQGVVSKRKILKFTASHFDPLGLQSGISVNGVDLLSKLWDHNYSWDEPLKPEHQEMWQKVKEDYNIASKIKIPRCHNFDPTKEINLHVMTDASLKAGACHAYLQQFQETALVGAKFKLPQKKIRQTITVPQRELEAMVLGSKMAAKLKETYSDAYPELKIHMWTDATIPLGWLHSKDKLKVFAQNRVSKIRNLIPNIPWRHVESAANSADLTSRGLSGREYLASDLYWNGPALLTQETKWPPPYSNKDPALIMMAGTAGQPTLQKGSLFEIMPPKTYKTLAKFRRTLVQVVKFIHKTKKIDITPVELQQKAEVMMISAEQEFSFPKELEYLQLKTAAGPRPPLIRPQKLYLDKTGIIRCRGRMHMAQMAQNAKFPILLEKDGPLTKHRIMDAHVSMNHGGPELTKTKLRQNFWILKPTNMIKSQIRNCFPCKRASGPPFRNPTTPPLPEFRVQYRPYEVCGTDATGHIWLKNELTGNQEKYYILIITCANIRHVNLELVKDTTAQSVLDALKIHSSYYGTPKLILCDNASYFKLSEKILTTELGKENIQFLYNAVRAPWWGSIFERCIGTAKLLLRKTIQRRLLTPREMHLYLKETSTIINNRPLTAASNDIRDDLPLTPNKLLFGRDIFPLSQGRHDEEPIDDPSYQDPQDKDIILHWKKHDALIKEMKERFYSEYLSLLRERHSYDHHEGPIHKADIEVGDIVIVKGDKHRMLWNLAEVTELLPGRDNEIRAVKLHTTTGETSRPINLLYPLVKNPQKKEEAPVNPEETVKNTPEKQEETKPTRPKRAAARAAEERILAQQQYI